MELKWEDPPKSKRPGRTNPEEEEFAEALRSRPGNWARLFERGTPQSASMLASQIRKGSRAAFRAPNGRFDATSRTVLDDSGAVIAAVWVKFVRD